MVRPDDVESVRAREPDGREVILRAHEIAGRALVRVAGSVDVLDRACGADEESAALVRPRLPRVCAEGPQSLRADAERTTLQRLTPLNAQHSAASESAPCATRGRRKVQGRSTTIATPIPPPMHSDAT